MKQVTLIMSWYSDSRISSSIPIYRHTVNDFLVALIIESKKITQI